MPRTKVPRGRTTAVPVSDAQREFQRHVAMIEKRLEDEYLASVAKVNLEFDKLMYLHQADLHKTMGQLRAEEAARAAGIPAHKLQKLSAGSQHDDGYITDGSFGLKKKPNTRLSRSLSRSNLKSGTSSIATSVSSYTPRIKRGRSSSVSSAMGPPRSVRPRYRTPMNRVPGGMQYPPITPKVAPNSSITVLRRPRDGETVLSLRGSPLMVNSIAGIEKKANCNIPLADGTVISILPHKLRDTTDLPIEHMRKETRNDLKMLQSNLTTYLKQLSAKYKT